MKIKFWGVRGSLPTPLSNELLRQKLHDVLRLSQGTNLENDEDIASFLDSLPTSLTQTTGGNTTCFEVTSSTGTRVIVDMGTGLRNLGNLLMQGEHGEGEGELHFVMTHTHWDHIMGFPFFIPAYIPGNRIHIYGVHSHIQEAFIVQSRPICFPVALEDMGSEVHFHTLTEGTPFQIGDLTINTKALEHPGTSYAYRFDHDGRSLVIATDAEYKKPTRKNLEPYVQFFQDADLLVFDAQYTMPEVFHKVDWGHSSPPIGIDIAILANIKKLAFTHHDPNSHDQKLESLLQTTEHYHTTNYPNSKLEFLMATEGLELTL